MIKGLGHHLRARNVQQQHFLQHLRDQYADRTVYYRSRAMSRLKGSSEVTLIQDGMDQNKFLIPRHEVLYGKEFGSFMRPKCHISLCLAHGYCAFFSVSNPDSMKDSNSSCESLAHVFHLLAEKHSVNLPQCHINIHGDNTPRELKNNHTMRFIVAQVSAGNIRSASMKFLRCGHSHEDIDQIFSRLACDLTKARDIQVPEDFLPRIQAFATAMHRPFEEGRYVSKMDETRDWPFACKSQGTFLLKGFKPQERPKNYPRDVSAVTYAKVLVKVGFRSIITKRGLETFVGTLRSCPVAEEELQPDCNSCAGDWHWWPWCSA